MCLLRRRYRDKSSRSDTGVFLAKKLKVSSLIKQEEVRDTGWKYISQNEQLGTTKNMRHDCGSQWSLLESEKQQKKEDEEDQKRKI